MRRMIYALLVLTAVVSTLPSGIALADVAVDGGADSDGLTVTATESRSSGEQGTTGSGSRHSGGSGHTGTSGTSGNSGSHESGSAGSRTRRSDPGTRPNTSQTLLNHTGDPLAWPVDRSASACDLLGCDPCALPNTLPECQPAQPQNQPAAPATGGDDPAIQQHAPTPDQIRTWAVTAAAAVHLPAPAIGVAPDPEVNQWRIVAVGQPLWLSETAPASVSSRVSQHGITISITARRTRVVFDMGEATITCTTMTARPASADPRATSPDCGYVYQRKGDRTVTATASWQVWWSASGQSGTVEMTRASSRPLPVRELIAVNARPS